MLSGLGCHRLTVSLGLLGHHSQVIILPFFGVDELVELASEDLLTHELSLNVRRSSHAQFRIDVELFWHLLDTDGKSIRLDVLITLFVLFKEPLVQVMCETSTISVRRHTLPGILFDAKRPIILIADSFE